jgi:hypothetical protein
MHSFISAVRMRFACSLLLLAAPLAAQSVDRLDAKNVSMTRQTSKVAVRSG